MAVARFKNVRRQRSIKMTLNPAKKIYGTIETVRMALSMAQACHDRALRRRQRGNSAAEFSSLI